MVVVMCMDTRLDEAVLGLRPGDAHVIRNAGGFVSADVLRSIAISQNYLKTRRVLLVAHTDCGALHVDQRRMADELGRRHGQRPPWEIDEASTEAAALAQGRRAIEECPFLSHHEVDTAIYDVDEQALRRRLVPRG
jgi:carbonic anhydrase